jgi:hypothetical protein
MNHTGLTALSDLELMHTDGGLAFTPGFRCAIGTWGSAVTGGLGGAGLGFAVGTAVPGIGNMAGLAAGFGIGAAGGAAVGIASFCYE